MPHIRSFPGGLLLTLLFAAHAAQAAATFESLSSIRSINIGATVAVFATDDSGFSDIRSAGEGRFLPGYEYADDAVGLSGFGFLTPYGGGGASGRASQESEMTGERIYFNGFADVYATATFGGEDAEANASGYASSEFGYTFRLASPTTIRLDMASSGPDEVTSEFTFSLFNNDILIWDQIGVEKNFMWFTTFSVDLFLEPGDYTVSSHVAASSSFDGGIHDHTCARAGVDRSRCARRCVPGRHKLETPFDGSRWIRLRAKTEVIERHPTGAHETTAPGFSETVPASQPEAA
jgi:hypothetical protein